MPWPKGKKHSPELSKKLSEAMSARNRANWKNPAYREKTIEMLHNTGVVRGSKISVSLKGNKNCQGRTLSPEIIEKIRKSNIGKKRSDEVRANISQRAKEQWQDPETRRKLVEKLRGRKLSEETKTKMSISKVEYYKNPENRRILGEKIKQGIIKSTKDPERRRIRLGKLNRLIPEQYAIPMQPPAIREIEFFSVDTEQIDSIRDYFASFFEQLHTFLNQLPSLRDIQVFRRNWMKRTVDIEAFGNIVIKPYHWYIYHNGGRNESQFNLGLCKDYFRIGLGFEFTEASRGEPRVIQETYRSFVRVIEQVSDSFRQFVNQNSLEIEYVVKQDGIPKIVSTEEAVEWMFNPEKNAIWIFIGRLLRRNQDASILGDPTFLGNIIESVFKGFRPIWEKTQIMAKEIRV